MARGKFITPFEDDCIRVGLSRGLDCAVISRGLGRTRQAIFQRAKKLRELGTIDDLPMILVQDDLARWLQRNEGQK